MDSIFDAAIFSCYLLMSVIVVVGICYSYSSCDLDGIMTLLNLVIPILCLILPSVVHALSEPLSETCREIALEVFRNPGKTIEIPAWITVEQDAGKIIVKSVREAHCAILRVVNGSPTIEDAFCISGPGAVAGVPISCIVFFVMLMSNEKLEELINKRIGVKAKK